MKDEERRERNARMAARGLNYADRNYKRCLCHDVDRHRCPGLTWLRNRCIAEGRIWLDHGRLVNR